jgi:rubrerythrin
MKRRTVGVSGIVVVLCMGLAVALVAGEAQLLATRENLMKAYNGEQNAQSRYEKFAATADGEGYKSVAVLLRAAADSAATHAKNIAGKIKQMGAEPQMMLEVLDRRSTAENLAACLGGPTSADGSMYPGFIKQAEAEKDSDATKWFKAAYAAEVEFGKFFKAAVGALEEWKALGKDFAVCGVCGYPVMGAPPMTCPSCSAAQDKFKLFLK